MKIILQIHWYRYDPDPDLDLMKKVMDPDPAGQKSTDPTGSGSSSLLRVLVFQF